MRGHDAPDLRDRRRDLQPRGHRRHAGGFRWDTIEPYQVGVSFGRDLPLSVTWIHGVFVGDYPGGVVRVVPRGAARVTLQRVPEGEVGSGPGGTINQYVTDVAGLEPGRPLTEGSACEDIVHLFPDEQPKHPVAIRSVEFGEDVVERTVRASLSSIMRRIVSAARQLSMPFEVTVARDPESRPRIPARFDAYAPMEITARDGTNSSFYERDVCAYTDSRGSGVWTLVVNWKDDEGRARSDSMSANLLRDDQEQVYALLTEIEMTIAGEHEYRKDRLDILERTRMWTVSLIANGLVFPE